ncbi:MAG TPA: M48 family metallopeptidase [Trueperaceae bacterium]
MTPHPLPSTMTDMATGQRINLLDWKAANIRYSWLLAFFTMLLLAGIAYLLALAIDPQSALIFVVIAVVVAVFQSAIAYWYSDRLALMAAGAHQADPEAYRYLVHVVEAVAIGAGVPRPDIYVIDSPAPNAFATGRNPEHGAIAVTTGLVELLDRQELEGVIAHEMSHIRNYDILFSSMLAATVGAILLLRHLVVRGMRFGGRGRNRGKGGQLQLLAFVALVVLLILGPVLATLLRFAVSRRREYLADATGAYITRNPEGLASALEKLQKYSGQKLDVSEGVQHMFFTNPVKRLNAAGLFATHPPIEDRISRLRRM